MLRVGLGLKCFHGGSQVGAGFVGIQTAAEGRGKTATLEGLKRGFLSSGKSNHTLWEYTPSLPLVSVYFSLHCRYCSLRFVIFLRFFPALCSTARASVCMNPHFVEPIHPGAIIQGVFLVVLFVSFIKTLSLVQKGDTRPRRAEPKSLHILKPKIWASLLPRQIPPRISRKSFLHFVVPTSANDRAQTQWCECSTRKG